VISIVDTSMPISVDAAAAYEHCEQVVRTQARNFSYGIRLLPPPKRHALSAVYAFARRIDDIGDGTDASPDARLRMLEEAREDLHHLRERAGDPVLVALSDAAMVHPIPLAAFDELIDGCAADVRGTTYGTFADLVPYCRCVAGSIGRLSVGVFGADDPVVASPLADALGVGLQLTNILRDVLEDRVNGRIYLPKEDLDRFGCTLELTEAGQLADPPERLRELVRFEAARAREYYAQGLQLLEQLDGRSAACTAAMAGIYRRLLERIDADPATALSRRLSLPGWEKAVVAVRALFGAIR
jgi:phytoene synthase